MATGTSNLRYFHFLHLPQSMAPGGMRMRDRLFHNILKGRRRLPERRRALVEQELKLEEENNQERDFQPPLKPGQAVGDVLGHDWRDHPGVILPVSMQLPERCWASVALSLLTAHYVIKNPEEAPPQFQLSEIIALREKDRLRFLYPGDTYDVERVLVMVRKYGLKIRPSDPSPTFFIRDYGVLGGHKEQKIMKVLENCGPVVAGIDIPDDFYFYTEEHILGLNMPNVHPIARKRRRNEDGHYVLYVSSGTNNEKENFWLAQNCWGKGAHDKGYCKVARVSSLEDLEKPDNPTIKVVFPYLF